MKSALESVMGEDSARGWRCPAERKHKAHLERREKLCPFGTSVVTAWGRQRRREKTPGGRGVFGRGRIGSHGPNLLLESFEQRSAQPGRVDSFLGCVSGPNCRSGEGKKARKTRNSAGGVPGKGSAPKRDFNPHEIGTSALGFEEGTKCQNPSNAAASSVRNSGPCAGGDFLASDF